MFPSTINSKLRALDEAETRDGKLGTETLDNLDEWFGSTWYGKRFNEAQQKERELDQQLIDQGGPAAWALKIRNTPNPVEQRILKGISDVLNTDERLTTPATYIGLSAGIRGLSNVKFPRTYSKLKQKRILPKEERRMINITNDVEEIFNSPADVIRRAKEIYRHHPDAGWTAAIDAAKQLPKYAANAKLYIPPSERIGTQKGEPLMTTTGGDKPIPPSDNPLYKKGQKRNEQAKTTKGVIYPIVKDFGGSEVQAKEIWKKVNAEFQDVQKATSKLNELYRKWGPNSKIDIIENEDGTFKVGIVPRHNIALPGEKPRYKASWQFEKDHIRAVMNKYGESRGMNMAENMEIIFGKINREKSNLYQLPEDILSELAVPKNINEYIFNELHPEYKTLQSKIPQRFKESFTKNVLNDFYEQVYGGQPYKHGVKPTVGKKKWPSIMRNITQKYARLYKDENFLIGLTMLDDQPFWERAGDEIPQWAQLLKMPRNKRDPFWMQLPPKAQKRWIRMVERKKKSIQTPLPVEGGLRRTMSKEKFYKLIDEIFPDD